MNDSPGQPTDNYAAMEKAGFYFINEKYVGQAFLCAIHSFLGNVLPPPPYQYANLVAPFQEYLSDLLKRHVKPDELSELLNRTQAERHQIIFNFVRKDFEKWFCGHPDQACTTRADTLWSLYRLVNDLRWYTDLRMWECCVSLTSLIQRLTTILRACARFGHPLTELPKVLPAIVAKDTRYLEGCIDVLKGEVAATYQHFCQDEATLGTSPDAGTLPKPEAAGFDSSGESDTGCLAGILKKLEKLDGIAQDTAAIRTELSVALQEGALRVQAPNEKNLFVQKGETWQIIFDGQETNVKNTKGARIVHLLLSHPDQDMEAEDVIACIDGLPPAPMGDKDALKELPKMKGGFLREPVIDQQALSEYKTRLKAIGDEMDEAKESDDLDRVAALEAEHEDILKHVKPLVARQRYTLRSDAHVNNF